VPYKPATHNSLRADARACDGAESRPAGRASDRAGVWTHSELGHEWFRSETVVGQSPI